MVGTFACVVFDFDGTLVDSNALKRACFFDVARTHRNGEATMADVLASVTGDRFAIWTAFASAMGLPDEAGDRLARNYSDAVDAAVAGAAEMPGATDLLATLSASPVAVFLSSATPEANLAAIVERRGWRRHFDGVYGRPASKAETLRRHVLPLAGAPHRVAIVGDGADDRANAAETRCRFFPVGEARGAPAGSEPVYALADLAAHFLPDTTESRSDVRPPDHV